MKATKQSNPTTVEEVYSTPQDLVQKLESKYDELVGDQINAATTRERNQITNSMREVMIALNSLSACGIKTKVGSNPQKYFGRFFERISAE